MLYAQTGIHALSAVPGCPGHTYEDRADKSEPRMSVHGCAHETHLRTVKDPLWAASVLDVPLTAAEQKRADEAEAERDRLAVKNSADSAAVLAQTAQLLAEISAKLNGAPAEAPVTVPAAPEATAPAAGAAEPVKAPRPRKGTARAGATA